MIDKNIKVIFFCFFSFENHDLVLDDIVILLSDFMKDKEYHKSTPTELAEELSKNRDDRVDEMSTLLSPKNNDPVDPLDPVKLITD